MDEYRVNGLTVKDDSRYERGNKVVKYKLYTFWLGDHGPFDERIPADDFDAGEFDRRVRKLQDHLRQIEGK